MKILNILNFIFLSLVLTIIGISFFTGNINIICDWATIDSITGESRSPNCDITLFDTGFLTLFSYFLLTTLILWVPVLGVISLISLISLVKDIKKIRLEDLSLKSIFKKLSFYITIVSVILFIAAMVLPSFD